MQYNFLNQLMQMYGINKMEPDINPLMQYQQQFGGQQFQQQPVNANSEFEPRVQQQTPQTPFQPQAPQQNTLSPQRQISPNFQMPQIGNQNPPPGYNAGGNPGYHGPGIGGMGGPSTGPWSQYTKDNPYNPGGTGG